MFIISQNCWWVNCCWGCYRLIWFLHFNERTVMKCQTWLYFVLFHMLSLSLFICSFIPCSIPSLIRYAVIQSANRLWIHSESYHTFRFVISCDFYLLFGFFCSRSYHQTIRIRHTQLYIHNAHCPYVWHNQCSFMRMCLIRLIANVACATTQQ